jgi:hypothetical protein
VISNRELWACAQHYVTEHGQDAGVVAALRCDELLDAGDYQGARTYQRSLSVSIGCSNRRPAPSIRRTKISLSYREHYVNI